MPDATEASAVRDRLRPFPDRLSAGEWMIPGQRLISKNGRYLFKLQVDGDAVLSGPSGVTWRSGTSAVVADALIMHSSGDLALRGRANELLWHTNTEAQHSPRLVLQDDGNLVIYDDHTPLWASHTGGR